MQFGKEYRKYLYEKIELRKNKRDEFVLLYKVGFGKTLAKKTSLQEENKKHECKQY